MQVSNKGLPGKDYKPFSQQDLKEIDEAVMEILSEVGVEVNCQEALDLLEDKGAEVDSENTVARLPRAMVEEAIASAPSSVLLRGREKRHDLHLEENRVHFGTGGTVLNVLDLETGEKRKINIQDVADIARLVDALENIHFFLIPVYPEECNDENVDVNRFYASLKNTTKHVMGGVYSSKGIERVIEMATDIAGSKEKLVADPFISFITCVMSPLKLDRDYTKFLMQIAREGLPVAIPAEPLSGGTGPVTVAGNIVMMTAESLAGLVVAQLVNPGTPVIFASTASVMDLKSSAYITGAVEAGLMHAGVAQVAQYYQLPLYATAGMSDSKVPDIQAGYEKAITAMLAGLSGANYIHDAAGLLEFCMTVAYEQYVIDNEIIGMIMRAIRGIEVNSETLGVDAIKRVGPGGHFLTEEHTLKYMRDEYFEPEISDRQLRENWEKDGSLSGRERAVARAKEILNSHQPAAIDQELDSMLQKKFPEIILDQE